MNKKTASKESIEVLISNIEEKMSNLENTLNWLMSKQWEYCIIGKDSNIMHFYELYFGATEGIYEALSYQRNILTAESVYEKRFYMQWLNLNLYEWCKYLVGKDKKGILCRIESLFASDFLCEDKKALLKIINEVMLLGKKCNVSLRKITSHYDNPMKMYTEISKLDDEDIFFQNASEQIRIYLLIQNIIFKYLKFPDSNTAYVTIFPQVVNEPFSKSIKKKSELYSKTTARLKQAWRNLERDYRICQSMINFPKLLRCETHNCSEQFGRIIPAIQLAMEVQFIESDINCVIKSYLNAKTLLEQSFYLRKIYILQTSMLTQLYGYNKERYKNSIWYKLTLIPEFQLIEKRHEIEANLKKYTSHYHSAIRNCGIHLRKGFNFNSSLRWNNFRELSHPIEFVKILHLIKICNDLKDVMWDLILKIEKVEKNKRMEKEKQIQDMLGRIKLLSENNPDAMAQYNRICAFLKKLNIV